MKYSSPIIVPVLAVLIMVSSGTPHAAHAASFSSSFNSLDTFFTTIGCAIYTFVGSDVCRDIMLLGEGVQLRSADTAAATALAQNTDEEEQASGAGGSSSTGSGGLSSGKVIEEDTRVVERIIERITEVQPLIIQSNGITQDDLDILENELRKAIARAGSDNATVSSNFRTIAHTNKIDQLQNVTITNATIESGISGLTDSDIPNDITASNYFLLTGGTLTGSLTGTSATFSGVLTTNATTTVNAPLTVNDTITGTNLTLTGNLTVSGTQSLSGALSVPYIDATSTTATSTFAGGIAVQTNALVVDSVTGNVGIGTTSPSHAFSVLGNGYIKGDLTINGNSQITEGGELTVGDKVISDGEIGIGTSSPYAKLGILNTSTNQTALALYGASGQSAPLIDIYDNETNNTNLLRLTAGGNFGLGTTSPSAQLSLSDQVYVGGAATSTFTGNVTVGGNINFDGSFLQNNAEFEASQWTTSGDDIYFNTGNVGIGTTSPYAKLSVAGSAGQTNPLFAVATTSSAATSISYFSIAGDGLTTITGKTREPTFLAESQPGGAYNSKLKTAVAVFVSGNYAYVAAKGNDSLAIIDISDPNNPTFVAESQPGGANGNLSGAQDVFVSGNYAYVTARDNDSLAIIDISDPNNPTFVAESQPGGANGDLNGAHNVFVSGNYAYVTTFDNDSLAIIDISDPNNPTFVAEFQPGGANGDLNGAIDVFVSGNYAYVTSFFNGSLAIIDISDPNNPTFVAESQPGGAGGNLSGAQSVFISGNYAYVTAANNNSLAIIDISDPNNPTFVAESQPGGNLDSARGVFVSGNYAYVAAFNNDSLAVVDISDPNNPTFVAESQPGGVDGNLDGAIDVFVSGNYAYVTSFFNDSLAVIDVGALDVSNALVGNLKTDTFQAMNMAQFNQGINVKDSLNVGTNALIGGALTIQGTASSTLLSTNINPALIVETGYVGIGTTSPWRTLSVNGTAAFTGLTNDGSGYYTCVDVNTGELATSTTACGASSERFKTNINDLTYGLDTINQLRPVSFDWKEDYIANGSPQIGLIAEEVASTVPEVIGYDDDGQITNVDYPKLIAVAINAIQEIAHTLTDLKDTIAGFADRFTTRELCVSDEQGNTTCLTKGELDSLLEGGATDNNQGTAETQNEDGSAEDTEAPALTITGNNPAYVEVGATYKDLGATVTDNEDDNLGIRASVNGTDVGDQSNISIDTSTTSEHTIEYRATDQAGNVGTATRTVIVGSGTDSNQDTTETQNETGGAEEESTTTTDGTDTSTGTPETTEPEDTTSPEITLEGSTDITLTVDDTYTEPSYSASDDIDGDITSEVIVDGDTVDTSTAGTYTVTYSVEDAAGNTAEEKTRTITVVEPIDTTQDTDTASTTPESN